MVGFQRRYAILHKCGCRTLLHLGAPGVSHAVDVFSARFASGGVRFHAEVVFLILLEVHSSCSCLCHTLYLFMEILKLFGKIKKDY